MSRAVETSPPNSTLPPPSLLWPTSHRVASRPHLLLPFVLRTAAETPRRACVEASTPAQPLLASTSCSTDAAVPLVVVAVSSCCLAHRCLCLASCSCYANLAARCLRSGRRHLTETLWIIGTVDIMPSLSLFFIVASPPYQVLRPGSLCRTAMSSPAVR